MVARLVNQIIDVRRNEAGALAVNASSFDLAASLSLWMEGFRQLAYKHGIGIRLAAPDNLTVHLDAEKTERIFFNLMSNAFKHTPEGGHIDVVAAQVPGQVTLTIADNGPGIPQGLCDKVFEQFYVAGDTVAGAGLGLALVKAFVEVQGGQVSAADNPGGGALFTVKLPTQTTAAPADAVRNIVPQRIEEELGGFHTPPEPRPAKTVNPEWPTILLIDDNPDMLSFVAGLLDRDCNVVEATSGAEGIRLAIERLPDAIVCDVMMPGLDGFECTRRLKSEQATRGIPVVLLTACASDDYRAAGYDSGADSYIQKPFSPNVLRSKMHSLLHRPASSSEAGADAIGSARAVVARQPEEDFLTRLKRVIEERLDDCEFGNNELAAAMQLSRTQLFRKAKTLAGMAPTELILQARLRRAASLLAQPDKTIAEVSYAVGFATPSYFTKCFREKFGELPSDYQARLKA